MASGIGKIVEVLWCIVGHGVPCRLSFELGERAQTIVNHFPSNPGQPLPGSSATLTDTGTEVSLDYHLSSPVTINGETNFFLFSFDFKDPPVIDIGTSSITYLAADPGVDFTQVSFVCQTDVVPDARLWQRKPCRGDYAEPGANSRTGHVGSISYRNRRAVPR